MSGNKKAAVNWTIGKLINIVLLTIVMALIIFGMTTGGLNPLIENVEGKFNEVLIMLNIKDDVSDEACFFADVVSLGGGEKFLKEVGLEGDKSIGLNICRDRMCNFTGDLSGYRNKEGVFENLEGGRWKIENDLFVGSLDDVRFNRELYSGVLGVLEEAEGVDFFTNPKSTKKFVLTGTPDTLSAFTFPMVATWQNNIWVIKHGEKSDVFIGDDNAAIDVFAKKVWGGNDDEVSYDDGMGGSGEIGKIVGNNPWIGSSYNELDSNKEIEKLKAVFAEKKTLYLREVYPSREAIENLTKAVEGKEVFVGGNSFKMEVGEIDGEVAIILVSEELRLGMRYIVRGEGGDLVVCDKDFFPFVLVEWVGSWKERGNSDYYKSEGICFENVYRESLIERFLSSKCR